MSNSEFAHALSGAGGGALSMIVSYPLVTLATLAQTTQKLKEKEVEEKGSDESELGQQTELKTTEENEDEIVKAVKAKLAESGNASTLEAAKEILRTKGVAGFYSGLESAVYGVTFSNFIYYYFYEFTSNAFLRASGGRKKKGLTTLQSMATGAVAGAITVCLTNPVWVANTRLLVKAKDQDSKSQLTLRTILEIAEKDGVKTLFAGVLPALVLVINPIIQYTIFEQVKNVVVATQGIKAFTATKAFFIGALGKLVATTITYPYITLKSRMHVKKNDAQQSGRSLSMVQQLRKIVAEEGVDGLYRGLGVKLSQSILMAAFLFYFKEQLFGGSVRLVQLLQGVRLRRKLRV